MLDAPPVQAVPSSPPLGHAHGLDAALAWLHQYWVLCLVVLLLTVCCLLGCLAVVQHTQAVLALCLLKAAVTVLCCFFPRIRAWFEEQMAQAEGGYRGGPAAGLSPGGGLASAGPLYVHERTPLAAAASKAL